jgi:hypothetical protein
MRFSPVLTLFVASIGIAFAQNKPDPSWSDDAKIEWHVEYDMVCFDCGEPGVVSYTNPLPPVRILDLADDRYPPEYQCPAGVGRFEVDTLYFICIDAAGTVLYPIPNKPIQDAPPDWESLYGTPIRQLGPIKKWTDAGIELTKTHTGSPVATDDVRAEIITTCSGYSATQMGLAARAHAKAALRAGDYDNAFCWLNTPDWIEDDDWMGLLGICYEKGWGTAPDPEKAAILYKASRRRAADLKVMLQPGPDEETY